MIKFEGKAEELSWRFPPFPSQSGWLSPRQQRAAERTQAAATSTAAQSGAQV
jgi:hypothetical protein